MKVEIRNNGVATIDGYVNVVGRESRVLRDASGEFIEIIAPKTFQRALDKNDNVGFMFNHERDIEPISMKLWEDNIGLRAIIETNDEEVIKRAKDDKLTGWSFGFYDGVSEWETRSDGMRVRTVTELDLLEVSILDCTPAYYATSVEMRGEDVKLREQRNGEDEVTVSIETVETAEPPRDDLVLQELKRKKFEFVTSI